MPARPGSCRLLRLAAALAVAGPAPVWPQGASPPAPPPPGGRHAHGSHPLSSPRDLDLATPGPLEGRPAPADASPLQARVDAAAPGSTIEVGAGTYHGDVLLDRPVRLVGRGRPRLQGSGRGSVVRIRAGDVTVEGFDVDGGGGGDLLAGSAGVHVAAERAQVRDCRIENALFGVYLREAHGAVVEGNSVRGIAALPPAAKGSAIHVWRTVAFVLDGNDLSDTRDGIYVQDSTPAARADAPRPGQAGAGTLGTVRRNDIRRVRYGLHVMGSEQGTFELNRVERSDAGAVLMYARRLTLRRNRFEHQRGFTGVGMLIKDLSDSRLEDNLVADDTHGLEVEAARRVVFRRNLVAGCDVAVVIGPGSVATGFAHNAFVGNLLQAAVTGRGGVDFDQNYWSTNDEPDLDGDGRSDRAFPLSTAFDRFRGRVGAVELLAQSPAALALAAAGRAMPVLEPASAVYDRAPLVRPPDLRAVPTVEEGGGADPMGLLCSGALLATGLLLVVAARGRALGRA